GPSARARSTRGPGRHGVAADAVSVPTPARPGPPAHAPPARPPRPASGGRRGIIVDPVEPLPEAREFVIVQSEYYIAPGAGGISAFDYGKMMSTSPDFVVFNGRPDQYVREPLRANVGDRVRFYVVSAGPSHP